ncbi:MAG: tetratricopeptide repeat protein, partial [Candidatus Binataceae bacterium]
VDAIRCVVMRERLLLKSVLAAGLVVLIAFAPGVARSDAPIGAVSATPANPAAAADSAEPNSAKAQALVNAAINMTDSTQAVKLLWQATAIDPALEEAYLYLGLFYNSRSDFGKVVQVYQKLIKYEPKQVTAYLNIGEAYMSFSPPKYEDALPYYKKAFELDPGNSFAALRIGEIYAQQNNRGNAVKYLKLANTDNSKNPAVAAEANKVLREMGAM